MSEGIKNVINRRQFLTSAATAGAGLILAKTGLAQTVGTSSRTDDINIALIGAGTQGRVLMDNMRQMEGIRFKAVVDVWPYYRSYVSRLLQRYGHDVNEYEDYREMLAQENDLDAVVIATPDWVHAEQTVACLRAGLHVYCEKEMAHNLEACREMVLAERETGKLLQIGHQRRSNPRYLTGLDYLEKHEALGRVTHVLGHWRRATGLSSSWPERFAMDQETLERHGYDTMERFRNWRWYRQFSGGPIADLGSHQIDIFNWFLKAEPKSVVAMGGNDYYPDTEWYDNMTAMYEWDYNWGGETKTVRGVYQVMNTSSHYGFFETFMGQEGSMVISELLNDQVGMRRENHIDVAPWEDDLLADMTRTVVAEEEETEEAASDDDDDDDEEITIGHSIGAGGRYYRFPEEPEDAVPATASSHWWHLVNFFDAIREPNQVKLSCPGDVGYETAVAVLRVNDAWESGSRYQFSPGEFRV